MSGISCISKATNLRNVACGSSLEREDASSTLTASLPKHSAMLMAKMPKAE